MSKIITGLSCIVNNVTIVELQELLTCLLLFDRVTIDSPRLQEVPALVNEIGLDAVKLLLKSGAIDFRCRNATFCETNSLQEQRLKDPKQWPNVRPVAHYDPSYGYLSTLQSEEHQHVHYWLQTWRTSLSKRETIKLKGAFVRHLKIEDATARRAALERLLSIARQGHPIFSYAIKQIVGKETKDLKVVADEAGVKLEPTSFSLTPQEQMKILFLVAECLRVAEETARTKAVVGCNPHEMLVLSRAFLSNSNQRLTGFKRLMEVTDRCGFRTDIKTIERLIQFRETTEALALREWLQTVDDASPKDILAEINSFKVKIGHIACSPVGKAFLFAASILVDIAAEIPGASALAERIGEKAWEKWNPNSPLRIYADSVLPLLSSNY